MTAKEFLQQAFRTYRDVDSKIEQVLRLRELATRATSTLDDVPRSGGGGTSKLESAIVALYMKQAKLGDEIENLLSIWTAVASAISEITDDEARLILEYRYLAFEPWRVIASKMGLSLNRVYFIHRKTLKKIRQFQVNNTLTGVI